MQQRIEPLRRAAQAGIGVAVLVDEPVALDLEAQVIQAIGHGVHRIAIEQTAACAIVLHQNLNSSVEDNPIVGEQADQQGDAVVLDQDLSSSVEDNPIVGEQADQQGDAVVLDETGATLDGNQINGDNSQQLGDGLVALNGSTSIINNLVVDNHANQAGAGIYINNFSPVLTGNTIAHNSGDGIRINGSSHPRLIYNVVVGNEYGLRSHSGQPAQMTRNNVWGNHVINYSGMQPGDTDLSVDPAWVNGPMGKYYLSQQASGQSTTSRLVDACFDSAHTMGVDQLTTRTDGQNDRNNADMGYHYVRPLGRSTFLPVVRVR